MSRRKRQSRAKPAAAREPAASRREPQERLRPWLLGAACALLVARPLYPSETPAETGDGLPVVMLWIALAVTWMLGAIGRRRFAVRFGWIDAAVLALVAWHTLAAVVAASRVSPRPAVNMLWEWIGLGLTYFLLRQFVATRREARAVTVVMLALAAGLAAYGVYQFEVEMPQTRATYRADPERALREAGLPYAPGSPQLAAFEKRLDSVEPMATFALTNSLAGFLAPWLIVAGGIAVATLRGQSGPRKWPFWVGLAAAALVIAACLVLTKSRSAYAAVILGLLGLGVWWARPGLGGAATGKSTRARWIAAGLAMALCAVVIAAVAAGGLDVQVLSEAGKSLGYRAQYWQATMAMIADHPLLGCGPGNFQQTYTVYKLPVASEEIADPHNFLLEVWATAGAPAAAALVAVLGIFAALLWRARERVAGRDGSPRADQGPGADGPRQWADPPDQGKEVITLDGMRRADASRYALAGGAAGFMLAVPVGTISAAPPGLTATAVALPVALAIGLLLYASVERGRLPPLVPALGAAVLLVHLAAAGGIGFAGVASTLWLLVALGVNEVSPGGGRLLPWSAATAGLVASLALAFACHATAYSPVLRCRAAMMEASRQPEAAEALLLEAAARDPLASQPWRILASLAFEQWEKAPSPESPALGRFDRYSQTAVEKAPNSAAAWLVRGERLLAAGDRFEKGHEAGGRPDYHDRALRAYGEARESLERAVALYPNSALHRAKLAGACRALGDTSGFRQAAEAALRLDELTPHADKKLPGPLRERLREQIAGR